MKTVSIPLDVAQLIRVALLPINPNKCRSWEPELVEAVRIYIHALEAAQRT